MSAGLNWGDLFSAVTLSFPDLFYVGFSSLACISHIASGFVFLTSDWVWCGCSPLWVAGLRSRIAFVVSLCCGCLGAAVSSRCFV